MLLIALWYLVLSKERNKIKTSVKTNKNNLKFGSLLSVNLDKIFFIISFNINSENNYNLTKFAPY